VESIFSKESPVHDGAAIIRGNRIAEVGTLLPLSQEETLPRHYGTRHRAAIGLSEVSDSVILVVSEERGDISLVHRRNVEPIRDPDQLERRLEYLLATKDASSGEVRSRGLAWMSHGGGLLLTFLLVSAFWGLYAGRQFSLISLSAPVYYRNIPADLQLKKASAEQVEVQVSGRRGLVSSLDPQQVRAFLDLGRIGQGEHALVLESENIVLPPGLEVERITPSSITIEMEQILERSVEVKPDLLGPPPNGFEVGTVSVKPHSVRVRGPATILGDLTSIETGPIVLRNMRIRDGEASQDISLVLVSPSIQLLGLEQGQVEVSVRFSEKETRRAKGKGRYHRVREGDTLYEIGKHYGVSTEELRKLNKLKPSEFIYPGQDLKIPN
jgi:hypothetical protein